jgi:signal peptidase I
MNIDKIRKELEYQTYEQVEFMTTRKKLYGSIILTLLIPFLGMLNLGQVKKSIIYFCAMILTLLSGLAFIHYGFFKDYDTSQVLLFLMFALHIIASVHCYIIVKNNKLQERRWFSRWYGLLLVFAAILCFFYLIRVLILEQYYYTNQNKFIDIDNAKVYLYITKPLYRYLSALKESNFKFPDRKQVVVFRFIHKDLLSRVIALPGDTIELKNNILYVNDVQHSSNSNRSLITIIDIKDPYKQSSSRMTMPDNNVLLGADNLALYPVLYLAPTQSLIGEVKYLIWNYDSRKFILKELDSINGRND